jgi:hypothetical protein
MACTAELTMRRLFIAGFSLLSGFYFWLLVSGMTKRPLSSPATTKMPARQRPRLTERQENRRAEGSSCWQ